MPFISIVTPCYNEQENVVEVCKRVAAVLAQLPTYTYEHIFIDNASKDNTQDILRALAAEDKHVKVIFNSRNFGHITSPFHGMLQSSGEATIFLVSDLQDPPELIRDFLQKWEEGFKVVKGVKSQSLESRAMFAVRKMYYNFINRLSQVELTKNFTGFGLYDKQVMQAIRRMSDPYPYFRGMVSEVGFPTAEVTFTQPARKRGITKNNFYTLYDMAMLGITSHSKVPLRLCTMFGFALAGLSFLIAVGYFAAKLIMWNTFVLGLAPVVIGIFFFASVQLFFIGMLGEYIGAIHTQVLKRPHVIESERINFDNESTSTHGEFLRGDYSSSERNNLELKPNAEPASI